MDHYKINIHAHTIFSDGANSPLKMAMTAKELGHTALVITDHFYDHDGMDFCSLNKNTFGLLKKACMEAKEMLPVIIGLEIPFCGQEVLVFGGAAIKSIIENGKPNCEELQRLKDTTDCAVVLCHPGQDFEDAAKYVDGFEEYNSGSNLFANGKGSTRPFGSLEGKQRWSNSDAHHHNGLRKSYNIVTAKIENESDLIRYIKRGTQHEFYNEE